MHSEVVWNVIPATFLCNRQWLFNFKKRFIFQRSDLSEAYIPWTFRCKWSRRKNVSAGSIHISILESQEGLEVACKDGGTWVVVQSLSLTLCSPMVYSLPGSSVHGFSSQEYWSRFAISYSRGSSQSRGWTHISCISALTSDFLSLVPPGNPGTWVERAIVEKRDDMMNWMVS